MSLHEDRRGRVPFALVGVLLLLGASVYATGVADRAAPSIERPAGEAMDDASRDVRPALDDAIREAARDSAQAPVSRPANTSAGRALNDSTPFVDALELRIAAGAREELAGISREHDGVRATVDLPPVDGSTASFRRAKRGIDVQPVDDGSSMAVTVRNVTVRARENGRVVAQRRMNATVTVETPVLDLHQRTERYEARLNRGVLAGEGLARGLTGRLTAVTMARGYGRYAGAPIQNVLGNRHVELSTNAALLAQQRAAFGRADPDGARAVDVATVRVGVLDVLGGRHGEAADWTKTLLDPTAADDGSPPSGQGFEPEPPDEPPITAQPVAAADESYLDAAIDPAGSYRVRGSLRAQVLTRSSESRPEPRLRNWTLVSTGTSEQRSVTTIEEPSGDGEAVVDARREVTIQHTVERRWHRNGSFRTTTAEWSEHARVAVRVDAEYAPDDAAPDRPTRPLFERGGALDGPNLDGARERAATELLDTTGGIDGAAAAVIERGGTAALTRNRTVTAERPDRLEAWIDADRRRLREAVANVSVTVPRRAVGSGEANAPGRLADAVHERRASLVDAPETYDGVAGRARVAARTAYLDRVIAALERRAADTRDRNVDYRDELGSRTTAGLSELIAVGRENVEERVPVESHQPDTRKGGSPTITPDGSPAYLTLQSVDHEQVASVPPGESAHPLTARTTNWVAVPYGDAADGVVDTLLGGGDRRVSLGTAATTLIAANRTANGSDAGDDRAATLAANRAELTNAVQRSVRDTEREVCTAATAEPGVDPADCRAAVVDARASWPTLGHRAQAMANGSYAEGVADSLAAHGVDDQSADRAAIRVRVALRERAGERETGVPAETTNRTAGAVQQMAGELARQQVSGAIENRSRRAVQRLTGASRLPAGVPVAPPPYPWIATVNAWSVTVRGEYGRFAVRAQGAGPDGTGGVVRYVRDGSTVRFDADGDGERERLGRNEGVSFEASTTVVAVVPPGPPGVGDVDGNRDERSPGWPCPGVEESDDCERAPE